MIKTPYMGLFLEMGLGKTLIVLEALKRIKAVEGLNKVLILAPPLVVEHVWTDENKKWGFGFEMVKVNGSPKQRILQLKQKADIYLLSSNLLSWLVEKKMFDFKIVIIDEYADFRSPSSSKFKALKKVRPRIKRLYGLTGTPTPNGIYGIWGLVFNLDMGKRLFKTQKSFQEEYFRPGRMVNYIVYNWIPRKGSQDRIYKTIEDICISMKSKDYIQLPGFNTIKVYVDLDKKLRNLYNKFKRDLIIEYEERGDLVAVNAAVLTAKLQQFVSGHVYLDTGEVQHIHNLKLDMLKELLHQADGESVLIFAWFKFDQDLILKETEAKKLNVDKWNTGKQKIGVLHPKSGGHGLNLQKGGHIIIWFGPIWDLELYQQACKRLHRPGQVKTVSNYIILGRNTIDDHILKIIDKKKCGQDELFKALKKEL